MAQTVIAAFNEFLKNVVNLDPDQTKKARTSRDWLIGQINNFPDNDKSFPLFYSEKNIFYGSFAKNTKKRPLDDVDLMICLHADSASYTQYPDFFEIKVSNQTMRLNKFVNEGTDIVNSRKIINALVEKLKTIHQYRNAEIKRNQEAATLNLTSYDWTFDIVPCFITREDQNGRNFYLIPDGKGNWKKTDPRIDQNRVLSINKYHNNNVLNVIRAVKFWNTRAKMPSVGTYQLENMILDYYSTKTSKASEFVDIELPDVFYYLSQNIYNPIFDPKGMQGDLNTLTYEEKRKINLRAYEDSLKAHDARNFERLKDYKKSIDKWGEIFGDSFPKFI